MKVTVIGTGYVGLVAGTCFADLGNNVICLDVDSEKIAKLNSGVVPIYEPGLESMLKRNIASGSIEFTTDKKYAISSSDVIFIAVGTPMGQNHEADLRFVRQVAKDIGTYLNGYKVIVNKSTVPVGTADLVKEKIKEFSETDFDVVSNPEFLREGNALNDFLNGDRIVVGADSEKAKKIMKEVYESFDSEKFFCDVKSAEMIKYASNCFLAVKISFINEIANLCEKVNADVENVAKGMGLDSRIGNKFLNAGIGYGGSCFPKDVKALIRTANDYGVSLKIIEAAESVNDSQKLVAIKKLISKFGSLNGKRIGLLGLSFKPNTDDLREATSLVLIEELQKHGAKINAFDPSAMNETKKMIKGNGISFKENASDVFDSADAVVLVTEWNEFNEINLIQAKKLMKGNIFIDGRNMFNPKKMSELGFDYSSIGRK
ncbi:MAG: UDP-glucose/GDP-mannose dehydrogenase family protein [Candidatus Diapherotrites archaeon]|nr:UDP-glucose/GDP-mannose dehydrogenase family protein [Candidatus Diapherotrites archaeon]